jgi:nucleoside triphosphatase
MHPIDSSQNYPEPIVTALILNKAKEILLIKSPKWIGQYVIPGGHVNAGERLKDALVREVKEETGLDIEISHLLNTKELIFEEHYIKEGLRKHFIMFNYLAFAKSDCAKIDNREVVDCRWVLPEDALQLEIADYVRELIQIYRQLFGKQQDFIDVVRK